MQIASQFSGHCRECGGDIARGETVEWTRGECGVRHLPGRCDPELLEELREEREHERALDEADYAADVALIAGSWPRIAAGDCQCLTMRRVKGVAGFADANGLAMQATTEIDGWKVSLLTTDGYLGGNFRAVDPDPMLYVACEYQPGELRLVKLGEEGAG